MYEVAPPLKASGNEKVRFKMWSSYDTLKFVAETTKPAVQQWSLFTQVSWLFGTILKVLNPSPFTFISPYVVGGSGVLLLGCWVILRRWDEWTVEHECTLSEVGWKISSQQNSFNSLLKLARVGHNRKSHYHKTPRDEREQEVDDVLERQKTV